MRKQGRPKKRFEGKTQDKKDYPNKETKGEGWKENQVEAVPREERISTSWTAAQYSISNVFHSPKLAG